jgi:glutamine synthetase type III
MVDRKLWHIEIGNKAFDESKMSAIKKRVQEQLNLTAEEASYFVISDSVSNNAYKPGDDKINLLYRDGSMIDIADAADQLNISVLSNTVEKFFMCYPKECVLKD